MGTSLLDLIGVGVDSFFDWICSYSQNAIIFSKRVRTPFVLNVSGGRKCGWNLRHVCLHLAGRATKGEQRYRIWFVFLSF